MLGHLSFGVSDLERSVAFYDPALAPLGLTRVWTNPNAAGYGYPGGGDLLALKKQSAAVRPPGPGFHLAFNARSHAAVDAFHRAGVEAGFRDNGAPGVRERYSSEAAGRYYAAFLLDPDGNNVVAGSGPPRYDLGVIGASVPV